MIETAIIVLDPEGRVTLANRFACHLLGTSEADILGQNWFKRYVPESGRQAAWELFRAVISGEVELIHYFEQPVCTGRGETLLIGWHNSLLCDEAGRVTGWLAMGEDVSEQRKIENALRQSETQFRALFENVPVGIFRSTPEGKFLAANPALARMLGYGTPAEVLKLDAHQLYVQPEQRQRVIQAVEKYGEVRNFEVRLRRKNGREIIALGNMRLVKGHNGETLYYEGSLTDITGQKRTEESLHRRVVALEALYQSGIHLNAFLEPRQIARSVIAILQDKLSWHHVAIRGYDPKSDSVKVLALCIKGLSEEDARQEEERLNAIVGDPSRGLSGWVIRHGETVRSGEVREDPRYVESYAGIRSGLYVPLKSGERIIGSIAVESEEPNAFDEADEQFLSIIAAQVAAGIENARLYQESKEQAREFAALYETARAVAAHHDLERVLETIVKRTARLMGTPICGIYLYEEQSNDLVMAVNIGSPAALGVRLKMGEGLSGQIAQSRQPLRLDDYQAWTGRPSHYDNVPLRAVLGVPMIYNGELLGVLNVAETGDSERKFNDNDARLLSLFANTAASAIYSARLFRQLEMQVQRLSALHEVDSTIAATTDLRLSLRVALDHVIRLLNVDAACVFTFDPTTLTLEYVAGNGFRRGFESRPPLRLGEGLAGKAALQGTMVQSLDPQEFATEFSNPGAIAAEGFRSCLAVPLTSKGKTAGVLEIYRRETFSPDSEWLDFLHILAGQIALAIDHAHLLEKLERANTELMMAYDATIEGWSRALDLRDHETEGHTQRVSELTLRLARAMRIPEHQVIHIHRGALLHDIGKIGVPDSILHKEGPLTPEEWEIMRQHPRLAYDLMNPIVYLRPAVDIPYCHHEKWDGTGYPQGLKGEEIPLAARIFAVADVFDALTSDRPYRKAWPVEQALQYITDRRASTLTQRW
ncbi:MAG: GAF domain-containing protein [Anaerolineae bacterium]